MLNITCLYIVYHHIWISRFIMAVCNTNCKIPFAMNSEKVQCFFTLKESAGLKNPDDNVDLIAAVFRRAPHGSDTVTIIVPEVTDADGYTQCIEIHIQHIFTNLNILFPYAMPLKKKSYVSFVVIIKDLCYALSNAINFTL